MSRINLRVGKIACDSRITEAVLGIDGKTLQEVFSDASHSDIDLNIDHSKLDQDIQHDLKQVETLDLHRALESLTGNPRQGQRVTNIGLIFAGKFKPKNSVFGLMFDKGILL